MDKECFLEFKDGNTQDFEYLFKLYCNRIYGFANKFIDDEDDCKEIAQGTFVKLWNSRDAINKEKAVQSCLFQIAKNACLNLIRQNKVRIKYASQYIREREKRINSEILLNPIHRPSKNSTSLLKNPFQNYLINVDWPLGRSDLKT